MRQLVRSLLYYLDHCFDGSIQVNHAKLLMFLGIIGLNSELTQTDDT